MTQTNVTNIDTRNVGNFGNGGLMAAKAICPNVPDWQLAQVLGIGEGIGIAFGANGAVAGTTTTARGRGGGAANANGAASDIGSQVYNYLLNGAYTYDELMKQFGVTRQKLQTLFRGWGKQVARTTGPDRVARFSLRTGH